MFQLYSRNFCLGETDVNLTVDNLTLSLANAEGVTDEACEEGLVRDGVLAETSTKYSVETEIQAKLHLLFQQQLNQQQLLLLQVQHML